MIFFLAVAQSRFFFVLHTGHRNVVDGLQHAMHFPCARRFVRCRLTLLYDILQHQPLGVKGKFICAGM